MKSILLGTAALAITASVAFAGSHSVVRMGTEGAYPPYNFINDSGEVDGFERELGDELCARAELTCEWVTNEWDSIIPNLVSGNYDVIIAGMSITAERDEVIDFTQNYTQPDPSSYLALEGADVDFEGGVIAAQSNTIQAAFTQSKSDAFGKVEQDGDVVLQRPTRMRWRFTTGEQSEFVTDGGTLWIYTKADNQVLRMTDTSQATNTANAFLTSLDSLDEMFVVTLVAQDAGPTLDLVPREATMYKRIRLSLDPSLVLRAVVFTDVYDNVTDLRFRDVKLNGPVDPSIFTFVAPAGAAVIDN